MKQILTLALGISTLAASFAGATSPYCSAFQTPDHLEAKYRRLEPMGNAQTGWIVTKDQLGSSYQLEDRNLRLLRQIVSEFTARDMQLAILMAPPRPLAAGQSVMDQTLAQGQAFDVAAAGQSFSEMTAQVRNLGIIMPDLSGLARPADGPDTAYYFKRDTHWTPLGAALSAQALARYLDKDADWPGLSLETYSEKGSLARIARRVCDAQIKAEVVPLINYPSLNAGLFDTGPDRPNVVLAGSSFSDRYKRDALQTSDALGYYLQAAVLNYSVSGGGAIGAIEGLVSSGLLQDIDTDLVIWELPYTEGLNKNSALRQLLGALQAQSGTGDVLVLDDIPAEAQKVQVTLTFDARKPKKIVLRRKAHVPSDMRQGPWAVSLFDLPPVVEMSVVVQN